MTILQKIKQSKAKAIKPIEKPAEMPKQEKTSFFTRKKGKK